MKGLRGSDCRYQSPRRSDAPLPDSISNLVAHSQILCDACEPSEIHSDLSPLEGMRFQLPCRLSSSNRQTIRDGSSTLTGALELRIQSPMALIQGKRGSLFSANSQITVPVANSGGECHCDLRKIHSREISSTISKITFWSSSELKAHCC